MRPDPEPVFPEWRGIRAGYETAASPDIVNVTGSFSGTFAFDFPTPSPGPADRVQLQTTRYSSIDGGPIMAGSITLPTNQIAHTPVLWTSTGGAIAPAPADAAVLVSDAALGMAALNAAGTSVDTTPIGASGSFTVTVSSLSRGISDSMTV